jgi:adenosylcobinamide-GDP ribazoletransferase
MGLFPLVGVVVGGIAAAVYALAHLLVPASIAAPLALLAAVLVTGGLHEDGLADTADGFGGGADRDAKLAIMRDPRIGAFGAVALILVLALRGTALAALDHPLLVAGALIAAHALARAAMPFAMRILAPARPDGLGAEAGRPGAVQTGIAATLAVIVVGLVLPVGAALAAVAGALIGALLMTLAARGQIGGYTGDVLGAIEQVAETAALIGAVAAS